MPTPSFVISRAPAFMARPPVPAGKVRPAGQLAPPGCPSNTASVSFSGYCLNSSGAMIDVFGNPTSDLNSAVRSSSSSGGSTGGTASASGGLTPQQQTALFNTVGSAIGTAGSTIAAIIQSGNQVQIADIQARTQAQIAALQTQAQIAASQGNQALATQQANQAAQMQQFLALLAQQKPDNTVLYVVGGIAALAVLGGIAYIALSGRRH